MTEEEALRRAHQLHRKIGPVLSADDLKKVAQFIKDIFDEGSRSDRNLDPSRFKMVEITSSDDPGRVWIYG